jgi:hypothetical protein
VLNLIEALRGSNLNDQPCPLLFGNLLLDQKD